MSTGRVRPGVRPGVPPGVRPARTGTVRGALAVLGAWVVALVLAGCVSIPTSGPVAEGDGAVDEPGSVFPLAYSPPTDASPTAIVQGFLSASAAGLGDSYAVAKQYLTVSARTDWAPDEGVVVYSTAGTLEFATPQESQVSVALPVVATVDGDGRYLESPPEAEQDAVFDLVQDAQGQWRITALDDGVLLSQPIFDSVYRATPLYFLTPGADALVPETRWFPQRNTATYAVRALLNGPSAWLRDAVRTAFPEGTGLAVESVPVDDDGVATVDLTAAVATVDAGDRALLKAQLAEVLELPGIREVAVTIAGLPMVEPPAAALPRDPSPGSGLQMIRGDRVVRLDGSELTEPDSLGPLGVPDPHGLAWAPEGPTVLLSGPDTLVLAPAPGESPRTLLTLPGLVEPSVDPSRWVWSGQAQSPGRLVALQVDGTTTDVDAQWLEGRTVRSLRLSREGTRIAVVSSGPDGVTVDVAGVVRDGSGTPQRLTERLRAGARLLDATELAWVDESTLAVLGTSGGMTTGPTVHLVPVSGSTRPLPAIEGAVSVAAGRGERAVYVATGAGVLLTLRGTSWIEVATGVRSPAFPG